jgi:regulator of sirC expression with transglutaminase-like and TPR domain
MTREEAERVLTEAGKSGDAGFPLFDAAVACAIHDVPERDTNSAVELMEDGVGHLGDQLNLVSAEEALAETLSGYMRLTGDLLTYDSLDNADILSVCTRRRGLPVALGLIYLHVGRQCGLQVAGVDFPGHFLLRIETGEGPLALDPFSEGRVVLPSELSRRALRTGLTPDVASKLDVLMTPVSDRAVLIRLQNNIFARAQAAGDFARAERSALRRALLDPADHRPWLDVAAAREGQGALAGALQALAQAQFLDGGAAIAARAARERVRMRLN